MDNIEVNKQGLLGMVSVLEEQDEMLMDVTGLLADIEAESCGAPAARLRMAIKTISDKQRRYRSARVAA